MLRNKTITIVILVLIANILITILPNILYGIQTLFGTDLYYYYSRVNGIYYRNIPIFGSHLHDVDVYPPGLFAFLASIKLLTNFDTFQLDFSFRVTYTILFVLFMFIIANRIDRKYSFFALSMTFIFHTAIFTSVNTNYMSVASGRVCASNAAFSIILMFLMIYAILRIFSEKEVGKRDVSYLVLIFLAFTAHGLSHVGPFIWNVIFFVIFLSFFVLYALIKGSPHYWTKTVAMVSVLFLSLAIQILLFWRVIVEYLIREGNLAVIVEGYIGQKLPVFIIENYYAVALILIIVALGLIASAIFPPIKRSYRAPGLSFLRELSYLNPGKNFKPLLILVYVLVYAYSVAIITREGPRAFANVAWDFPYTLYFGPPYSSVNVLSKSFGVIMYLLSFCGILFFLKQTHLLGRIMFGMYLISYFMAFNFLMPWAIVPHRMTFGLIMLFPFAVAAGLLELYSFSRSSTQKFTRLTINHLLRKTIFIGIMVIIILIPLLSVIIIINAEPSTFEHTFKSSLLNFGSADSPYSSSALINFIDSKIPSNIHILIMPQTDILTATTSVKPTDIKWRYIYPIDPDTESFDKYMEKHKITHFVVTPTDSNYESTPKLNKFYVNSYGEPVYVVNNK